MNHIPHYVFAVWMVGGIQTVYDNMKNGLEPSSAARTSWVPIEMYPDDWITRIPPISMIGTWKNSMATWNRMRRLRHEHGPFDAAYILEQTLVTFLWRFRSQTPFLLSTDMTPLFCAKRGFWYAVPEFDPSSMPSRAKQAITASVYRSAFHMLPWSRAVRDSLIEDYGVPENRVTVLPPGLDLRFWRAPDRQSRIAQSRKQGFTVLHVGTDPHRKGADLLLALAREPEFQEVTFRFVTSNLDARQLPNVHVHAGLQPNSAELQELYRAADVFVLPTRADTYSMVALEAMATGLPVIISRVGGIEDIVEEGSTGFLTAPDDLSMLRDRIRRLRAQPALALSMGESGRRRIEEHFDLEKHLATVMSLMHSAARSRPERKP
jgi:glycosyltransferase involved in cell wall biosynthesis